MKWFVGMHQWAIQKIFVQKQDWANSASRKSTTLSCSANGKARKKVDKLPSREKKMATRKKWKIGFFHVPQWKFHEIMMSSPVKWLNILFIPDIELNDSYVLCRLKRQIRLDRVVVVVIRRVAAQFSPIYRNRKC